MTIEKVSGFIVKRAWLRIPVLLVLTFILTPPVQMFWALQTTFETLKEEVTWRTSTAIDHFKYWWNYKPEEVEEDGTDN